MVQLLPPWPVLLVTVSVSVAVVVATFLRHAAPSITDEVEDYLQALRRRRLPPARQVIPVVAASWLVAVALAAGVSVIERLPDPDVITRPGGLFGEPQVTESAARAPGAGSATSDGDGHDPGLSGAGAAPDDADRRARRSMVTDTDWAVSRPSAGFSRLAVAGWISDADEPAEQQGGEQTTEVAPPPRRPSSTPAPAHDGGHQANRSEPAEDETAEAPATDDPPPAAEDPAPEPASADGSETHGDGDEGHRGGDGFTGSPPSTDGQAEEPDEPAEEPAEEPTDEPTEEPADEPAGEPAEERGKRPRGKPCAGPAGERGGERGRRCSPHAPD